MIIGKQAVIGVHQLALADRSRGLLGRHILRALQQSQLANAHGDCTGRNEHDLMPRIFQVADDLAKLLDAPDIQPSGRVCQR